MSECDLSGSWRTAFLHNGTRLERLINALERHDVRLGKRSVTQRPTLTKITDISGLKCCEKHSPQIVALPRQKH
jgi:hypothetical protein